jgi:hypothetical protein
MISSSWLAVKAIPSHLSAARRRQRAEIGEPLVTTTTEKLT